MYSHQIIFKLGDGGKYINAEFGFDSARKVFVYKIVSSSDPLELGVHQDFVDFMKMIEVLYTKYQGLPLILSAVNSPTTEPVGVKEFDYGDATVKIKINHK